MEENDIYAEISSIRNLMERSTKFISLSGLSGVLAGIYALIGAVLAYFLVADLEPGKSPDAFGRAPHFLKFYLESDRSVFWELVFVGLSILLLSVLTGILLTIRKAKRKGESYWNPVSKRFLASGGVPLLTGGLMIIIFIYHGHFAFISSSCLVFYGLALISASAYTYRDVWSLGLSEIILGLLAAVFPGYGLLFWSIGFGILHIVYGTVMHFKYDR